jgi:hypothetical protein
MPPQARSLSLAPGDDLLSSIAERAAPLGPGAWAQAVGQVEAVELRLASEGADPVRSLRGRFTLVSLCGPAGGPLTVTLARSTDAGLELLGGQLVRARSAGVSVLLTPATPDEAPASLDERPPRAPVASVADARPPAPSPPAGPTPAARPVSPAPPAVVAPTATAAAAAVPPNATATAAPPATSWGEVARASERDEDEDDEDEEAIPTPGDLVDHFSFGLCEVLTSDGERLRIRDLRGPGRIREISLNMLTVSAPTTSNNKRLFRLLRK